MAEDHEPATAGTAAPRTENDPATRGALDIRDRAATRIVTAAALEVEGVLRRSGGLSRLTGREYPRALVSFGGGGQEVAASLQICLRWPCPLLAVTTEVRDTVARRLHELTGMHVARVDVSVARFETEDAVGDPKGGVITDITSETHARGTVDADTGDADTGEADADNVEATDEDTGSREDEPSEVS